MGLLSGYEQIGLFGTEGNSLPPITTYSGMFDFTPESVCIVDIAYALAGNSRYGGHSNPRMNVAQHSCVVAALSSDPFEGLMHDAHEAYVVDVPKPLKSVLKDYDKLEAAAAHAVRAKFSLPLEVSEATKLADVVTLFWEAYWLIHDKGEAWGRREDFLKDWMVKTKFRTLSPEHSESLFKTSFDYMYGRPLEQQLAFVRNVLRPELGIPKDVDIYVQE